MIGLAGEGPVEVLDNDRHAGERQRGVDGVGLGEGPLVAGVDDGVDLGVDGLGRVDRGLHELTRCHLSLNHEVCLAVASSDA